MGQINCQCQNISTEENNYFKRNIAHLHTLSQQPPDPTVIFTKIVLKSSTTLAVICLSDAIVSFGTTSDSDIKPDHAIINSFKIQMKYKNKYAYAKDCSVGLGAFVMKKKIIKKSDGGETLLNIGEKWVFLCIKSSQEIVYSIYQEENENKGTLDGKKQQQIILGDNSILLITQKYDKEYSIKLKSKEDFFVWLGEERKIRSRDILRLGSQLYEVESINKYLQTSNTIKTL